MQRLFERVQQGFQAFVDQRDDLVMIITCADNDTAVALRLLRQVEQASEEDVFLLFADPFHQAPGFVEDLVERLRVELLLASEQLVKEGEEPLPDLPEALYEDALSPEERMLRALTFARSLFPLEGGQRLVWAVCPMAIHDREAYLRLVAAFIPWQGLQPWMRQAVRLIFRDAPDTAEVAPALAEAPRTRLFPMDMGHDAMEDALVEQANDESAPVARRMEALLATAMMDYAHGRDAQALEKYDLLLCHYQWVEDLRMQALVINGMGDIHHRLGDLDGARKWYECAVPLASKAPDLVIFHTAVKSLGDVTFKQQDYATAEQCYDGAEKLATKLYNPEAKVQALHWRGLSQEQQGAVDRAVQSWEGAAQLCRSIGGEMRELLRPALACLERGYGALKLPDKRSAAQAELASLGAGGKDG